MIESFQIVTNYKWGAISQVVIESICDGCGVAVSIGDDSDDDDMQRLFKNDIYDARHVDARIRLDM